jgi:uncharacterized membrane protein
MTHVANIGERGALRRRKAGIVWLVLAIAVIAVMFAFDAPRVARLALVIPFGLAAVGFLQAKAKT